MTTLHYSYGYATLPEIAWTFLGILGAILTALLLLEAYRDLRAVTQTPTFRAGGARHIIAHTHIRGLAQRLLMLIVLTIIGLLVITTPSVVLNQRPTLHALAIAIGFIFCELTLVAGAIQDRRDRTEMLFQIRLRRVDALAAGLGITSIGDKREEQE